jgi:alpha-tubulin suppressor-like RCC1 family protein
LSRSPDNPSSFDPPGRRSRRRLGAGILAIVLAMAPAIAVPGPAAADPAPAFDHSKHKGKIPGTRGPLPKGFSTTEFSVKFKTGHGVRLRGGAFTAADDGDADALRAIIKKYPGVTVTRAAQLPETEVNDRRAELEERVGRKLPDLNSWFRVKAPDGNAAELLEEFNTLPSVEIAQAVPTAALPAEPLRSHQYYRNPANSTAGKGVDSDYANTLPGGKGQGVRVFDFTSMGRVAPPNDVVGTVAAGNAHTVMVSSESGQVWATGANDKGQLGAGPNVDRPTGDRSTLVQVAGLTDVKYVDAGGDFSLAIKNDGTVWAWGDNSRGQLGTNSVTLSRWPVRVPGLANARAVAAGDGGHALAVLADGTVWAWGNNSQGQLGDGTTTSRHTPARVANLTAVGTYAGSKVVAAGAEYSAVVANDSSVRTWGANTAGQLGDGTTTQRRTPVMASNLWGATQVSAGAQHTLVRMSDNSLRAFGANTSGQLGDGTTTNRLTPITVSGVSNPYDFSAGGTHSVVAYQSRTVWAWGGNASGQLGDGTTTNRTRPVQIGSPLGAVAAGQSHTLAAMNLNGIRTWGGNSRGQLGIGTTSNSTTPVEPALGVNKWNVCHEDLANRPGGVPFPMRPMAGNPCLMTKDTHHPTAVAGIIAADDTNGVGIAGMAPNAEYRYGGWEFLVDVSNEAQPGDVFLYEIQFVVNDRLYPGEYFSEYYDATVYAVARGAVVVEAAGNGSVDLDDPGNADARVIMDRPNSGAIMVGAGAPSAANNACESSDVQPELTALPFTNYGSRVDLQAYGRCVTTLGDPDHRDLTPSESNPNKMYDSDFNGTSSASPIVVGAVAALQGVAKQRGSFLTPAQVLDILERTGTPQPTADALTKHIGPLPNARAAIETLTTP